MFGAIIGDIIGSPYEYGGIKTKDFRLFLRISTFTDDIIMTVAVGDALMQREIEGGDLHRIFVEKMREWGGFIRIPMDIMEVVSKHGSKVIAPN